MSLINKHESHNTVHDRIRRLVLERRRRAKEHSKKLSSLNAFSVPKGYVHVNVYGQCVTVSVLPTPNIGEFTKGAANTFASVVPFDNAHTTVVVADKHSSFTDEAKRKHPRIKRISVYHHTPAPHYHVITDRRLPGTESVRNWPKLATYLTVKDSNKKKPRTSTTAGIPRYNRQTYTFPYSDTDTLNAVVRVMDAQSGTTGKDRDTGKHRRTWLNRGHMARLRLVLLKAGYSLEPATS